MIVIAQMVLYYPRKLIKRIRDRRRNEDQDNIGEVPSQKKMEENRLRWFATYIGDQNVGT